MTMTDKSFWTYEHDGELQDLECETQAAAQNAADEWFADYVNDTHDDLRNGDTLDDEIELVRFHYDDDGEQVIDERIPGTVEYEHYHGDYAEHFRQSDYI